LPAAGDSPPVARGHTSIASDGGQQTTAASPRTFRCESCGGPADERGLCGDCERVFHSVLNSEKARPSETLIAAVRAALTSGEPGPPEGIAHDALAGPWDAGASSRPAGEAGTTAPESEVGRFVANGMRGMGSLIARLPNALPKLDARTRAVPVAVAVVVIVVAIGVPLRQQLVDHAATPAVASVSVTPGVKEPSDAQDDRPDVPAPPARVDDVPRERVTTATAEGRAQSGSAGAKKPTPAGRATASVRKSTRPARPARPPVRETAPVLVPISASETPAVASLTPVAPSVAPATPAPEPAAEPVGPLFEISQVNEPPRVASRVDPQVPGDWQARAVNDVVILRVLVSQGGRPSTVNVLRGSRAGPVLDDAAIAAVKQWTFSPARRRGQAVSCWFNVGVPLRATD
jgi:TonB family protein